MPNSKTLPVPAKPAAENGWIRKSDLDAWLDRHLPVPTQVISNEEYVPIPQTQQQRRLEQEIVAGSERQARRLGMDRRQFLTSACGTALAFAAREGASPAISGFPEPSPTRWSKRVFSAGAASA